MSTTTIDDLVAAVQAHAREHYSDGAGWDYVIETMDAVDIAAHIGRAKTPAGAIRNVGKAIAPHAERDAEARAAAAAELKSAGINPAAMPSSGPAARETHEMERIENADPALANQRPTGEPGVREGSTMWAALEVLKASRKPLTPAEVYDKILAKGLAPGLKGKTPVASISARLATAHKRKAHGVIRPERGRYTVERKSR